MASRSVTPPGRATRWLVDGVVALLITLVNAATISRFLGGMTVWDRGVAVAALAVVFAALLLRRARPLTALGATVASTLVVVGIGLPLVVVTVAPLVVVYAAAGAVTLRRGWTVLAAAWIGAMTVEAVAGFPNDASTVVGNLVALGVAWILGSLTASRQRYVEALEVRTAELEAARTELADKAVQQERLRIARELHDVVAHALSVVTVRAGVAAHVAVEHPEEAVPALAAIEKAGRTALVDMRRMVGLLREAPESGSWSLAPQPGIADLPALVEGLTDAGPAIELDVGVADDAFDASVGLAVYRIVQESLTNAVRHSGASTVWVRVVGEGENVLVEVRDDGTGPRRPAALATVGGGPHSAGHGLPGIRERVAAHGGVVTDGQGPEGGFLLVARLPAHGGAGT